MSEDDVPIYREVLAEQQARTGPFAPFALEEPATPEPAGDVEEQAEPAEGEPTEPLTVTHRRDLPRSQQ